MPPIEFLVDRQDAGQTIASLLRSRYQLTWTQAKRLIEGRHVRVAGSTCTDPAQRLRAKNRIWIREGVIENKVVKPKPTKAPPPKQETKPVPAKPKPKPVLPPIPLPIGMDDIVYVDDSIVVVNKPAGLTTMRSEEEAAELNPRRKGALPKTLADFLPIVLGTPNRRVYPVHRIDRDTSGLLVFARTSQAEDALTKQFRKHTADRRYLALVRGTPKDGRIESILIRDRGDGRRGSAPPSPITPEDGRKAVTFVKSVERWDGFALIECRLETGRTHQVRIHCAEAGFPLCGERTYDRPLNGRPIADSSGAERPMLHALRLGFQHPLSGDDLRWEQSPPADFRQLWDRLRGEAQTS